MTYDLGAWSQSLASDPSDLCELVAVSLSAAGELDRQLVCVIGVYRLARSLRHRSGRRRYHRYQPELHSRFFDHEDRQLIIEAREALADRTRNGLTKLGPAMLSRCSEVSGVDNYRITQRIRKGDLEIHLGRDLIGQILTSPDYSRIARGGNVIGSF